MPKRVAIVGAGPSGLTSAKTALSYSFEPVVFEKASALGGIWRFDESPEKRSVMHCTSMKYSKELCSFSDFPPPEHYSTFMNHSQALEYLEGYAANLSPHLRLNTEVVQIRRSSNYQDSGQWTVEFVSSSFPNSKDGKNRSEESSAEDFDAVLVCTGINSTGWRPPKYRLEQSFKGRVIHSQKYKSSADYLDKTVVVVGCGNSAVDIACDLARGAKKVYLAVRRRTWLLDQLPSGKAWDATFNSRINRLGRKIVPKYIRNCMWEMGSGHVSDEKNPNLLPKHRFLAANFTLSNSLPLQLANGRVEIKPNLLSFTESGVEFDDRSVVEGVDEVILATGYEFNFSLIEQGGLIRVRYNDFHLFQHMYLPDLAPHHTLAVIGHVQPRGSVWPIAEMQARYFFHALSGKLKLPAALEMKADLERRRCETSVNFIKTRRHTQIEDYVDYMDQLASAIGAKPNLLLLICKDPRLALKCFCTVCTAHQYRLRGPNAWQSAGDWIMKSGSDEWNRINTLKTLSVIIILIALFLRFL